MVTVATAQIKIDKESKYRNNLQKILQYISLAGSKKVDVVCFPETSLVKSTKKEILKKINFRFLIDAIRTACKENMVCCVFSTNIVDKSKVFNRGYFIDFNGKILHSYDKIHLFRSEKHVSAGKNNKVIKTKFGTIGLIICWDSSYPEYVKSLAAKGANIIFCPSYIKNYGRELESYLQIPYVRAFETSSFFVNCDSANSECARYSVICSPGKILASVKGKEGLAIAKLDMDYITKTRTLYGLV